MFGVGLGNLKVKSSPTLSFAFGLPSSWLFSQIPSLAGYPEHRYKALPTMVLLPGAAWLHDADWGLPRGGSARAERGCAGGERG